MGDIFWRGYSWEIFIGEDIHWRYLLGIFIGDIHRRYLLEIFIGYSLVIFIGDIYIGNIH